MANFVRTTVKTNLMQREIYNLLSRELPDFTWREGDSDMQGLYISGMKENYGQIQFWLDADEVDVTISLRLANLSSGVKMKFLDSVVSKVLPIIGEVGEVIKID